MTTRNFNARNGLSIDDIEIIDSAGNAAFSNVVALSITTPSGQPLPGIDQQARDQSNTGISLAQSAFDSANNVAPQIQPAFDTANSGIILAQAAFDKANTGSGSSPSETIYSNANNTIEIEQFSTSDYRGGTYDILAASSYGYQLFKLLIIHDSYNATISTYDISTSGLDVVTFDASIVSGNVIISATPATNSTDIVITSRVLMANTGDKALLPPDLQMGGGVVDLNVGGGVVNLNV